MEDRIRQILEEQMMMRGQGPSYRSYGGNENNKEAAKHNPWLIFLKKAAKDYEKIYGKKPRKSSGSKKTTKRKENCWDKFRHDIGVGKLGSNKKRISRKYQTYLDEGKCRPIRSKYNLPE